MDIYGSQRPSNPWPSSGHQWSVVIIPPRDHIGHQWSSSHHVITSVISGHHLTMRSISGHQWSSYVVISGHKWSSVVISGHQWSSMVISGHRMWSSVINARPVRAVDRWNQAQSGAIRRNHRDHVARAHALYEELIGGIRHERATWMERAHAALGTARVPD